MSTLKDIDDQGNPEGRSESDCTNLIVLQLWDLKIRDPVYFKIGKLPGSLGMMYYKCLRLLDEWNYVLHLVGSTA